MKKRKIKSLFIVSILLIILLFNSSFVLTIDTGFLSPNIVESIYINRNPIWAFKDNCKIQSDTYATINLRSFQESSLLRVINFGFSIPNSIINGIEVEIDKYSLAYGFEDSKVRLVKLGNYVGNNYAKGFVKWNTTDTDTYTSYGGATDTWSSELTYSDVNDASFGVEISCMNVGLLSSYAYIDHIRIKIYYTIEEEDNNPPTWDTLTESADPLELGNNETISINVYDDSTINFVYIEINEINYTMTNVINTYSYSNWLPITTGINNYKIWMIDEYGNTNSTYGSILVQDIYYVMLSLIILFGLIAFMVLLYVKIRIFLPILTIFLFSLVIGTIFITENILPFSPYLGIFFLLFQSSIFIITTIDFNNKIKKNDKK